MPGSDVMREPAAAEQPSTSHVVARWCAEQGWPVHPLAPGRKTPTANCQACRDKHHSPTGCACIPAGRPCHGFHAATTSKTRIDAWWSQRPSWGVGVACGDADLIVIDIDAHSAPVPDRGRLLPGIPIHGSVNLHGLASGFDTLALLAALRGQPSPAQDASTLRVRTPSGGLTSGTATLTRPPGSAARQGPARRLRWPGRSISGPTEATSWPPPPAPLTALTCGKDRPTCLRRCLNGWAKNSYGRDTRFRGHQSPHGP